MRGEPRGERVGGQVLEVLLVDPVELLRIEHGARAVDRVQVEQLDHPRGVEELLVAVRPAEPDEVVQERLRQVAVGGVLHDADRAVALGHALAVLAEDHRQVGVDRTRRAERLEDVDLARGVVDVIVAADDVGDVHVHVVDDDREVVGRRAVGALDDEIVELGVVDDDLALDRVVDDDAPVERVPEADDGLAPVGRDVGAVAPRAVVAGLPALGARPLAHRVDLLGRRPAAVGVTVVEQPLHDLAVAIEALGLEERPLVVLEAEPGHAVEDRLHGLVGRAGPVGVLDAQHELPAVAARVEPAEERGAGAADVQVAGGARGEAGSDGHGGGCRAGAMVRTVRGEADPGGRGRRG